MKPQPANLESSGTEWDLPNKQGSLITDGRKGQIFIVGPSHAQRRATRSRYPTPIPARDRQRRTGYATTVGRPIVLSYEHRPAAVQIDSSSSSRWWRPLDVPHFSLPQMPRQSHARPHAPLCTVPGTCRRVFVASSLRR